MALHPSVNDEAQLSKILKLGLDVWTSVVQFVILKGTLGFSFGFFLNLIQRSM
jgi:hypothetical protein